MLWCSRLKRGLHMKIISAYSDLSGKTFPTLAAAKAAIREFLGWKRVFLLEIDKEFLCFETQIERDTVPSHTKITRGLI